MISFLYLYPTDDCHNCAICSARRLVISQEKSLVRRARSRSRDRMQKRHHVTDSEGPSASDQSTDHEVVSDSSTEAPTVIERTQNGNRSDNRDSNHNVGSGEDSNHKPAGQAKSRAVLKARNHGSWGSAERLSDDTSTTSSSDADSTRAINAKRSRSSSRGRKRPTTNADKSSESNDSGHSGDDARRSRSHSRSRKRSTTSVEKLKFAENVSNGNTDRKSGLNHNPRSTSRGRSSTRNTMVASDTELIMRKTAESDSEVGRLSSSKLGARLDLRTISNSESKYRESCRTDMRRRGSASSLNIVGNPWRKTPRISNANECASSDEARRNSDPEEMKCVTAKVGPDRRCSLPGTTAEGLMCASYNMPRVSSLVRKATIKKCRSEPDGFLSDGKSGFCSDAESTGSGRMSATSDLEDMSKKTIYECDEDSASCVSVDGSCSSDNSSTSHRSIHCVSPTNEETSTSPVSPNSARENSLDSIPETFCSRSPSGAVCCSSYCSDSGVSCFDAMSPIASQTKTAVIKTGEKTVARVRRLNTRTRRSSSGCISTRRDASRFPKEDNSTHLNSKELEMLIVGSCFGTGNCFDSFDTSDYESEPGSESHTDSDCQTNPRSPTEEGSGDVPQEVKVPVNTVASRLAGCGGSYSPVKASRERARLELAKMPKSDFRHKATLQHPHKALSAVELTVRQGESIYLHPKELEILRNQSPIWVMAYSKRLGRIGFVPAVYVNIRLEDLV